MTDRQEVLVQSQIIILLLEAKFSTAEPGQLSDGEMLGLCACPRISLESKSVQILRKSCGQAQAREKIRL